MASKLSKYELCVITATVVVVAAIIAAAPPPALKTNLLASAGLFCLAAIATFHLIPATKDLFLEAGIAGIDLNKRTTQRSSDGSLIRPIQGIKVPESMGLVCCTVYLVCIFFFIPFSGDFSTGSTKEHVRLASFLSALLSICCMSLLGFADDVLNLRWRHKLLLPMLATLPVLMVYYTSSGASSITLPPPIDRMVGMTVINIGGLYYVFMIMLAIFCTNAINIFSGVNGLESGQSAMIALSLMCFNILQIMRWTSPDADSSMSAIEQERLLENNVFSLNLISPFAGVAIALTWHNWWPSAVFVGDTWCYFAGMTFAVAAILGHSSKTLLLFFIPQVINFLYSIPQLFKIFPCPRHRMPGFVKGKSGEASDKIRMSLNVFEEKDLGSFGRLLLRVVEMFRLAHVVRDKGVVTMNNLTLNNYFLYVFGPMREDQLTIKLLTFQMLCSGVAFVLRLTVAGMFYDVVK